MSRWASKSSFNEAAGIHRRKLHRAGLSHRSDPASMRPPEFTGGNPSPARPTRIRVRRFNEAAGIHRRKLGQRGGRPRRPSGFNEAAGIHRRKHPRDLSERPHGVPSFNEAAGIHRRKPEGQDRRRPGEDRASMRPPEFTGGNERTGFARRHPLATLQ